MNKEDYVSLEVAKKLKEKGFNEPCRASIMKNGELRARNVELTIDDMTRTDSEYYEFLAPSLYEAQKWLRNHFNTYVGVDSSYNKKGKQFFFYNRSL